MSKILSLKKIILMLVLATCFSILLPNFSEASHMVPVDPNDRYVGAGCTSADDWSSCRSKITSVCSTSLFTTDSACLSQHRAHLDSAGLAAGPPVTVASYTTIPGCAAGSTYTGCLQEIGNYCRFDPTDPGCGTGVNSYRNQLLAAYNQPVVQPPITATICQPGDPISVCNGRIQQWCTDNNQPSNVTTCVTSLTASIMNRGNPGGGTGAGPGSTGGGTNAGFGGGNGNSGLFNVTWQSPLQTNITSIDGLLVTILNVLVLLAVPIVTLMIIYAGFLYVTARGNADQIKRATTALTYAIIGGLLALGAVAISGIIQTTIASFTAGP